MVSDNVILESTHKVFRAEKRGHANHGWLNTWHSFSFARYFDPEKINFGALRVWNDDVIQPGTGFDLHPHDNMEIITIPLKGELLHRDSMGHEEKIIPGEVQVMSAGKGLFHAEFNASKTEELALFQIWILPKYKNVTPVYNQRVFNDEDSVNKWQKLVGPSNDEGALHIYQDAYVYRSKLDQGKSLGFKIGDTSFGSYIMVVDGKVRIDGVELKSRDAMGITHHKEFKIEAIENSYLINIEVPDNN